MLLFEFKKIHSKDSKMILLFFTCCRSADFHYFSFNNSEKYLQHDVERNISKLKKKLKQNDQIFFIDSKVSNKNANIFLDMIMNYSHLSITFIGFQTKVILNNASILNLKDANITIKNMTFVNCDSSNFNIVDSSLNLINIWFIGNGHLATNTLLNFVNCTSVMTQVYFKNHNRPLIFSNSSILFSQYIFFNNIVFNALEKSVIYLITSSFEGSYIKLRNSNVSHLILLDNSNVFISNFKNLNSDFTSILVYSIFSNILIRNAIFEKCNGPILSSIDESTFHISNIQVSDHFSEYPLFTVINASLSVFDSQFQESQIDSIATIKECSNFFFTNSSIFYLMATNPLFEIQKTNSAEFAQITIYRLISQSDIGIIHAISSDYEKISQMLIQGFISQKSKSTAFIFSDVSSIYLDDFNYTKNGVPLMIVKQTNVVFANSYISQNDCIEFKENIPPSFITLLTESSLHFINSQFIGNTVSNGFSLLSVNSLIFFMKVTFSKNNGPIHFIQSDVKLSKSLFKNNLNRVIESQFSNINVHKCLFSSGKQLQIFVGNESKIIVNTTIVNSSHFIEADPSAYSVTIGSGRFLYSYKRAMIIDTKRTKLSLLDTKFNCSNECEKMDFKNDINYEDNLIDNDINNDENQFNDGQSSVLLINKKIINKNDDENKSELPIDVNQNHRSLTMTSSPFLEPLDKKLFQEENNTNFDKKVPLITSSIQTQTYNENSSIINLPSPQVDLGYQFCLVIFPIFFLCAIFIYRFKSTRFRRVSKKIFSPKGRYQL